MTTHVDQCAELLATLEAAAELVRRIATGDANAAAGMMLLCARLPYEGYVLKLRMDEIIGYVIEGAPHLYTEDDIPF